MAKFEAEVIMTVRVTKIITVDSEEKLEAAVDAEAKKMAAQFRSEFDHVEVIKDKKFLHSAK